MNYSELAKKDLYHQLEICEKNIAYHFKLNELHENMTFAHQEQLTGLHEWKDKLIAAIQRLNETEHPSPPPRDAAYQTFLEIGDD